MKISLAHIVWSLLVLLALLLWAPGVWALGARWQVAPRREACGN